MYTYWIILILTLTPTLNVPICLIIMQITICMINHADYHLPDHDANIVQLSNS